MPMYELSVRTRTGQYWRSEIEAEDHEDAFTAVLPMPGDIVSVTEIGPWVRYCRG